MTSKNKWTAGPWQRSGTRQTSPSYKGHMVGPDGDGVVVVPYDARDHSECLANANLIAAAPDLYEALELFLLEYDKGDGYEPKPMGDAYVNARKVLTKARGETL